MLKINEIFGPTIQGEGKSIGKKVVFIRLAFCNLKCVWCDTPYTWDFKNHSRIEEITEMTNLAVVNQVRKLDPQLDAVVISGGEPLLQQTGLIELCSWLKSLSVWIEIETNGTITPKDELIALVDQFNVSPKLPNSGNPAFQAIRPDALKKFASLEKTNFKFVISDDNDVKEMNTLVRTYDLKQIFVMAEGVTKETLLSRKPMVEKVCQDFGYTYSPRLHVELYGQRRGV